MLENITTGLITLQMIFLLTSSKHIGVGEGDGGNLTHFKNPWGRRRHRLFVPYMIQS